MEQQRREKGVRVGFTALGIGIGVAATLGWQATQSSNATERAVHAYERNYTDEGACLHGTAYDPARDASINVYYDAQSGLNILRDVSHGTNPDSPTALSFVAYSNGEFSPSDYRTAAFLARVCLEPQQLPQT